MPLFLFEVNFTSSEVSLVFLLFFCFVLFCFPKTPITFHTCLYTYWPVQLNPDFGLDCSVCLACILNENGQ